jgi:hypothetical protein
VRTETDRDFGPLSQELGRFAHSVDEGPLRERRDLIQGHILQIVSALHERDSTAGKEKYDDSLKPATDVTKHKIVGDEEKGKEKQAQWVHARR